MSDDGFWVRFWDVICDHEGLVKLAVAINITLLLLLLLASPGIEPGTDSHVILVFNVVLLAPLLLFTVFLLWRCKRRDRPDRF